MLTELMAIQMEAVDGKVSEERREEEEEIREERCLAKARVNAPTIEKNDLPESGPRTPQLEVRKRKETWAKEGLKDFCSAFYGQVSAQCT